MATERMSLKMVHEHMSDGSLVNARQNRDAVWTASKMQAFITSLYLTNTAPKEFLVREATPDDDDAVETNCPRPHAPARVGDPAGALDLERQIFDGNNRLTAINDFMNNKFPVQIGTEKVFHDKFPSADRKTFDKIMVQFTVLENTSVEQACAIAEKRNEGTPMSIGEKASLYRCYGTPACTVLDSVMNSSPFMNQPLDRAGGVKAVAQLIMSIEVKGGVDADGFMLTDYHGVQSLSPFFKSEDELRHVSSESLIPAFLQVGELCEGEDQCQLPASILRLQEELLRGSQVPTKAMYFYWAVIALVMSHLRSQAVISTQRLVRIYRTICERGSEAKANKQRFQVSCRTIDGLY